MGLRCVVTQSGVGEMVKKLGARMCEDGRGWEDRRMVFWTGGLVVHLVWDYGRSQDDNSPRLLLRHHGEDIDMS